MNDRVKKLTNRASRLNRTRSKLHGTKVRPRLSVSISNMHVSAQLIDDDNQSTLMSVSSVGAKSSETMTKKAEMIGEKIAIAAKASKIKAVVFDRGAKRYHGRVKALAEAARKNGLEF